MRLKRNPELFRALLMQQPQLSPVPNDLHVIVLGNPKAEHTITMVTNPYCSACAQTHKELEQLLRQNQNVKAQIIFACDDVNGASTKVATQILALADQDYASQALTSWYENLRRI